MVRVRRTCLKWGHTIRARRAVEHAAGPILKAGFAARPRDLGSLPSPSLPSRRSKLGSDSPLSTFETGAWCAARIMRGTRYPILTASVACICARTGEKWKSGARAGPEPGGRAWAKGSSGVAEHLGTAGPCPVRQSVDEHRLSYRRAVHGWRRLRHRWAVPRPLHPWLLGGHV